MSNPLSHALSGLLKKKPSPNANITDGTITTDAPRIPTDAPPISTPVQSGNNASHLLSGLFKHRNSDDGSEENDAPNQPAPLIQALTNKLNQQNQPNQQPSMQLRTPLIAQSANQPPEHVPPGILPQISRPAAPTREESDPRLPPGTDAFESLQAAQKPSDNKFAGLLGNNQTQTPPTDPQSTPQTPFEKQQAEYLAALAARNELSQRTGKDLDKHRDKWFVNLLKGAGNGALQGAASGNGLAGILGGAIGGGVGNVVSPHADERLERDRQLAKMDADNEKRFEGLKDTNVLDNQRAQIGGINSQIEDRKADNLRNDQKLILDNKKAAARDTFDEWRMKNGDEKQQSYEDYQKGRLALGDKQLLSRQEFNREQLLFKREQLAQQKELNTANNSTRLKVADGTNDSRMKIANVKSADEANSHIAQIKQFMGAATIDGLSDDGLTRIKKPRYTPDEVNQKVTEYLNGLRPEIRKQIGH